MAIYQTPPRAPGDSGVTVTDPYYLSAGDELIVGAATSVTTESNAVKTPAVFMTSDAIVSVAAWSNIRADRDTLFATGGNITVNLEQQAYIYGKYSGVNFAGTGNTFNLDISSRISSAGEGTAIISGGASTFNLASDAFIGFPTSNRSLLHTAVKLTSGGNTFNIENSAAVNGGRNAIIIEGANNLFNNKGQIRSETNTTIDLNSTNGGTNTFKNEGNILREVDAATKANLAPALDNRKVIDSKGNAVDIIHNGVASGSNATIKGDVYLHGADDVIYNYATGIITSVNANRGIVDMGAGEDRVINAGRIDNVVLLGTGDDRYDSSSSSYNDFVEGQAGSDVLIGGSGANTFDGGADADSLYGGAGSDTLTGGTGDDFLKGGSGSDAFVFENLTSIDTIDDFTIGEDIILLEYDVFTGLTYHGPLYADSFHIGAQAADANDRIIYDAESGKLFYDADGTGSAAAVQFALLSKHLSLTAASFAII
jgi:Ca2+-binding RTX toxin-like protein